MSSLQCTCQSPVPMSTGKDEEMPCPEEGGRGLQAVTVDILWGLSYICYDSEKFLHIYQSSLRKYQITIKYHYQNIKWLLMWASIWRENTQKSLAFPLAPGCHLTIWTSDSTGALGWKSQPWTLVLPVAWDWLNYLIPCVENPCLSKGSTSVFQNYFKVTATLFQSWRFKEFIQEVCRPSQIGQSCEDWHTAVLDHLHSKVKARHFLSFPELLINTEQLGLKYRTMLQPRVRPRKWTACITPAIEKPGEAVTN